MAIGHFAIYELPIPQLFQSTNGRRTIRISLAFDPPVHHSRSKYAGFGMSFRLVRDCEPALITEHFRRRPRDEAVPEIAGRNATRWFPARSCEKGARCYWRPYHSGATSRTTATGRGNPQSLCIEMHSLDAWRADAD
ncbi:hypothetical protein [Mesorhizobium sp. 113-3-3]|uniref:hypothetical protein n=1 Tax=Mesorhizobium sp. 113-3-3 TaxID=2744516 RepID=UPI0018EDA9FD|nr:hypothetical protein [Mesorhizobium sp. 113-3-3]